MRIRCGWSLLVLLAPPVTHAAPLLNADVALDAKLARVDKQFHTFHAPYGLTLDVHIPDGDDRAAVGAFLADPSASDFLLFTTAAQRPRTPREVIAMYSGHQGHGAFGGPGAAADAYRLMVLRGSGAPADEVQRARDAVIRALDAFHVMMNITGFPGGPARGLGRVDDVGAITPVPFPAECPDPSERGDTWRASPVPGYADWYFRDNVSKDQLLGATLGMGALWDAVAQDPLVDNARKQALRDDARALGHALMQPVEVRPGSALDLVIRDVNGCLTEHHDLNPREIAGSTIIVLGEDSSLQNGFNALAALAIMRTLYHVSGDVEIGAFYYDTMVAARGYPELLTGGVGRLKAILQDTSLSVTNFSNVNMAWTAFHQLLRVETDPALQEAYRAALTGELFDNEKAHAARKLPQAYFHLVHAGLVGADDAVLAEAQAWLGAYPDPAWDRAVENCDASERQAGACVALDGTPLTISENGSWGDDVVATVAVPIAVRPPNNYEWRADPRRVNGVGSDRLNSGADVRLAYWLGRLLARSADPDVNVSTVARPYPPVAVPDAGVAIVDAAVGVDAAETPDAWVAVDAGGGDATVMDARVVVDAAEAPDARGLDAGHATADAAQPVERDAGITATGDDAGAGETGAPGCACARPGAPRLPWLMLVAGVLLRRWRRSQ